MKIFVAAPANVATGGPELLHQLCFVLRNAGFDACMYYYHYDNRKNSSPIYKAYLEYENPYVLEQTFKEDFEKNVIVIPETNLQLLRSIKKARRILWWLSVDNLYNTIKSYKLRRLKSIAYKLNLTVVEKTIDICINKHLEVKKKKVMPVILQRDIIHLVQSYYAFDHCLKLGIDRNRIMYLSDYLNPLFIEDASKDNSISAKENIVLYNPKKGIEFTQKIIRESDYRFIPLRGLSREQMIKLLKKAKVYIDFGNHPGKDRIPREAAICGCCVITDKRGSAKFSKDVPIPDEYKFEDILENIPKILTKIQDVFENYEERRKDFSKYREMIAGEKKQFKADAVNIFTKIVADSF